MNLPALFFVLVPSWLGMEQWSPESPRSFSVARRRPSPFQLQGDIMKRLLLLVLTGLLSACAAEDYQRIGDLRVSVPWTRETPPHAPVAGGFFTVQNKGRADDRLLAVESSAAERVEIHEVREKDGVARMRQLEHGLLIPQGETVVLKPGSYHLMFIRPAKRFVAGDRVGATLVFEKAGRLEVWFDVRGLQDAAQSDGAVHH
jgi:copper(I)-binding protein